VRTGGATMPRSVAILRPQRLHPLEQVAAAAGVDEVDQVRRQLEAQRVDLDLGGEQLRGVDGRECRGGRGRLDVLGILLLDPGRGDEHEAAGEHERDLRQPRDQAEREGGEPGDPQRRPAGGHLAHDVGAHVVLARRAGHDQTGGDREQQGGDLGHQAVADRQQAVGGDRLAEGHAVLPHADREAAEQVHERDDDRRDRVTLDELGRTVHRTVEVGLGVHLRAAATSLVLVDEARVQVGVDGHLLTRHRVQREPGADLGDPAGAVGDDDELDDEQDREDDQPDDQRPADHEVAERVDDLAGEAVEQHQASGADVEGEPEQRHHQDHGGERREVERAAHEHRGHQDEQRDGDVQRDQQVEQHRGKRHHEHHDDEHDADGHRELAQPLQWHELLQDMTGRCSGSRPWHHAVRLRPGVE